MQNLAAGITYLTKKDKVSMLYLPHLTTNDDATHDVFVGTNSNKAKIMEAKVVDADIINNLLVLVKKDGISNDFPMGKEVDKTSIHFKGILTSDDGTPKDADDWVLVRIPGAILIPYGAVIPKGNIKQATYDAFDEIDPWAQEWLEIRQKYDPKLAEAVRADSAMKAYLPKCSKPHHAWAKVEYVQVIDTDEDDTAIEAAKDSLSIMLEDIVRHNSKPAIGDDMSMKTGEDLEESSARIPRKITTQNRDAIEEASKLKIKLEIFGAIYDDDVKDIRLPTLSEMAIAATETTKASVLNEAFRYGITAIADKMSESDDFLMRHIDLPESEKVVNAYMAHFNMYERTIVDLSQKNVSGLTLSMFIPD
jgi:hypothetical protein